MMMQALLAAHVIAVTLGYGALIISNTSVALAARSSNASMAGVVVRSSMGVMRIFGPLLALGLLLGFALMGSMHIHALSSWLIATYILIACAGVLQAAVAVPWHMRALRQTAMDTTTPLVVAIGFFAAFACIVVLMVIR